MPDDSPTLPNFLTPNQPAPDFRALFESAPGLYLVLTPDLQIVAASDAYLQATMTQREEILGRGFFEVFPDNPDDPTATGVRNLRSSLERVLRDRVADAMAVQKYDVRRPAAEGGGFEERYWSPVNSPVFGRSNEIVFIIHRVEDVTEFVRLKQQRSEQRKFTEELRDRAQKMEAEVFLRAQQLQNVNEQLRHANEELTGLYERTKGLDRLKTELLETQRRMHAELEQQVSERTAEFTKVNAALQAEILERKRAEAQFQQARKMEAIGTLAGGIAHDFNNLLTIISGYGEMLLRQYAPDEPNHGVITEILKAADRASSLTRQLLAFSRQQVLEPKVLDLNKTVSDTEKMLSRLIGEDISLATALDPNLGRVRADPGQVQQVIMNLAVNARDAMPEGGKLTIETRNVELGEQDVQARPEIQPGPYAMLTMSDTGIGMDEATRARIFEPFFTTKELGKGTGLGLATVYGIVKQSGGYIYVDSAPEKGTTFKVYLPLVEQTLPSSKFQERRPESLQGRETVLLVEDDAGVRKVTKAFLQMNGYDVMEAGTGKEAVRLVEQHAGPLHLLVTDVIMPQMDGRRVAEALLSMRPDLKVLYVSGYTDDAIVRHGILQEKVAFLQKPFTADALGKKVREVLDGE